MNKFTLSSIALAFSLAFSVNALADNMSKEEYKAADKRIAAEYKIDKAACGSLTKNAKDICKAEATGKEKVAEADIKARYKPSKKATYNASVARAEADYDVAKEKCNDKSGNDKDVCVKEAKAALVHAKADAKAQMKTSKANATANEDATDARMKAKEKGTEARQDAAASKRDADYKVEAEKCNKFSGDMKDQCIAHAKSQYGK